MKNETTIRVLKVLPLMGILVIVLHAVLPTLATSGCNSSCGGVGVTINGGGGCIAGGGGGTSYANCDTNYTAPPLQMAVRIGVATITGGGNVGDCPSGEHNYGTKDVSVNSGNTGAEIIPNYQTNLDGSVTIASYTVTNALRPGTITATIAGSGMCYYADNDCANATEVKLTTTGSIQVVDDNSGCSSCSSSGGPPTLGAFEAENNSLDFRIKLGMSTPRQNAGFLWLEADQPSTNMAQPAGLQLPYNDLYVEEITNSSGVIEQVNTPEGLVNADVISTYEYQLECFYAKDVGAQGTNGLYTTNAAAYVTYVIENPDGASASNRLWITEERGGTDTTFQYTYNPTNYEWDLLEPNSQILSTWGVANPTNSTITNYYRQVSMNGQIVSLDKKAYQYISGISNTVLLQEIKGTGSNTRTTTYTYYSSDPTNGAATNQLQEVVYPEGNWDYLTYDVVGEVLCKYSAYENSPPPGPGGPNTNGDDCLLTEYNYNDSENPYGVPYQTTVSIPVQNGSSWTWEPVSRSYHWLSISPGSGIGAEDIYDEHDQCVDPNAAYGDSGNLQTVYEWYPAPNADSYYSYTLPYETTYPDGTYTSYSYPDPFTTVEQNSDNTEVIKTVDS